MTKVSQNPSFSGSPTGKSSGKKSEARVVSPPGRLLGGALVPTSTRTHIQVKHVVSIDLKHYLQLKRPSRVRAQLLYTTSLITSDVLEKNYTKVRVCARVRVCACVCEGVCGSYFIIASDVLEKNYMLRCACLCVCVCVCVGPSTHTS